MKVFAPLICCIAVTVFAANAIAEPAGSRAPGDDTKKEGDPEAAERKTESDRVFTESRRQRIYRKSELSHSEALGYALLFPGAGNVYAEQYVLAGVAFSLLTFTGVFVGYGLTTDQSTFLWYGAGTGSIAYFGGIATSLWGVSSHNAALRRQLSIELQTSVPRPVSQGFRGISISIPF